MTAGALDNPGQSRQLPGSPPADSCNAARPRCGNAAARNECTDSHRDRQSSSAAKVGTG